MTEEPKNKYYKTKWDIKYFSDEYYAFDLFEKENEGDEYEKTRRSYFTKTHEMPVDKQATATKRSWSWEKPEQLILLGTDKTNCLEKWKRFKKN